jgi:hypothetical protein
MSTARDDSSPHSKASVISKSKYLAGLQCSRLLWVHYNDPGRLAAPASSPVHRIEQGHLVGSHAHPLNPARGGADRGSLKPWWIARGRRSYSASRPWPIRGMRGKPAFTGSGTRRKRTWRPWAACLRTGG